MSGVGFQPAGVSPAGYGAPLQSSYVAAPVLADSVNQSSFGSRRIDPLARDYVLEEGQVLGMDNIRHLVQLAVTKAEPQLRELDRLDSSFAKGVRAILAAAIAPLAAQRLVEFVDVSVRMNAAGGLQPGQAVVTMRWRDLTTNEERSETI